MHLLLAAVLLPAPRPALFVSIGPERRVRDRNYVLVVSKIVGSPGRVALREIARHPFKGRGLFGWSKMSPAPGGARFAIVSVSGDGGGGFIDVWNAFPLKHVGEIAMLPHASPHIDWAPDGSTLAVTDLIRSGGRLRVFRPEGALVATVPNGLRILWDAKGTGGHAIRVGAATPERTKNRAFNLLRGTSAMWVERFDQSIRVRRPIPIQTAVQALLGSGGKVENLLRLARPDGSVVGRARNWALLRVADRGVWKKDNLRRVVDQLGFPKAKAYFLRREVEDYDAVHSVGADGSLLFSGQRASYDSGLTGGEDYVAVRVAPNGHRRSWVIPKGLTAQGTVLWR